MPFDPQLWGDIHRDARAGSQLNPLSVAHDDRLLVPFIAFRGYGSTPPRYPKGRSFISYFCEFPHFYRRPGRKIATNSSSKRECYCNASCAVASEGHYLHGQVVGSSVPVMFAYTGGIAPGSNAAPRPTRRWRRGIQVVRHRASAVRTRLRELHGIHGPQAHRRTRHYPEQACR